MQEVDYTFKVLIIGNSSVGKSNILLRYSENIFNDSFLPTIGVDFKIKNMKLNNKTIKMNIWDTAGQERFKNLTATYYKGANGVMIVFDITDRDSFEDIGKWVSEVKKNSNREVVKLLVGNKLDLQEERTVNKDEAERLAEKYGMTYIEVSAKTDIGVAEAFQKLSSKIYDEKKGFEDIGDEGFGGKIRVKRKTEGGCCYN